MNQLSYIRLRNVNGVGPKRMNNILVRLNEEGQDIDELFSMSVTDIKQRFNLSERLAHAITEVPEIEPNLIETLESNDVQVLIRDSDIYPKQITRVLGEDAPSILYVRGNLGLLEKPSVGFCGSRSVTSKGIEVVCSTVQQIVDLGWIVVSGHARGTDLAAHRTALENGGSTIIVAPQGILDFKLRAILKELADPEQLLIISEFPPRSTWSVGNAMARNNTILALSDAMILVEARLRGGTFQAGKESLQLGIPLYVAQYQEPGESAAGNVHFLNKGAIPLRKSRETGKANISALRETVLKKQEQSIPLGMDDPNEKIDEELGTVVDQVPKQLPLLEVEIPLL